jgi:hypothetical protein
MASAKETTNRFAMHIINLPPSIQHQKIKTVPVLTTLPGNEQVKVTSVLTKEQCHLGFPRPQYCEKFVAEELVVPF